MVHDSRAVVGGALRQSAHTVARMQAARLPMTPQARTREIGDNTFSNRWSSSSPAPAIKHRRRVGLACPRRSACVRTIQSSDCPHRTISEIEIEVPAPPAPARPAGATTERSSTPAFQLRPGARAQDESCETFGSVDEQVSNPTTSPRIHRRRPPRPSCSCAWPLSETR